MVDSQAGNTTEPEDNGADATLEEFHDAETVIQGSGPSLSGNEKREMHILIEITYRDATEANTTPRKHLQILDALGKSFDKSELDMFDNKVGSSTVNQFNNGAT